MPSCSDYASQPSESRKVAVKVLRPERGADRFVQEIETTANPRHPNVLPLFDSGEDPFLYYVMPYGETVRDMLNREIGRRLYWRQHRDAGSCPFKPLAGTAGQS